MLVCLRVRDFAIIEELEVELGEGLNVVTGETGAGKSILVDALQLVLGAKGRPDVVRTGKKQAEVEAAFDFGDDPEMRARLEAAGIDTDGELIIRRVVKSTGRSRAYVNGRLATASQLAQIAAGLADISSQHEHHSLVEPASHLRYLDAFGRLEARRDEVARAYGALSRATEQLTDLEQRAKDRVEREDLLRWQIGEIDELAPKPGEKDALLEERERLRHADHLARTAAGAEEALYADDGALCESLAQVVHEVQQAGRVDSRLDALATQLVEARTQLEDAARELGAYARGVTVDPERLAEVEDRLERLDRLERKHGGSIEAALTHREEAARELEQLESFEEHLAEAERARDTALTEAREAALALRDERRRAAKRLGTAIGKELGSLGMGEAKVQVEVAPLEGGQGELSIDGARLTPAGIDRAELLIAPNRGEEARPLRRIASGGELSRAMLAIKRVLAGLGAAGLYVFDEVDAGVGGAVAEVIGRKLEEVSRHHQVLCITHLPQIAAFADVHFRVHKHVSGDRTRSDIERLAEGERLEEIARMLGGTKIGRKTRDAAAELLESASR